MKQIKENGWHLEKGSKGHEVEYWFPYDIEDHKGLTWNEYDAMVLKGESTGDIIIRPRYFYVFNASMITGIPQLETVEKTTVEPDELISRLSESMNVPIMHFINSSCAYDPYRDHIVTPPPQCFENSYEYNSSVLHELAHSTGHSSRLDRPLSTIFGSAAYAREELVAEITSAFMGAHLKMPEGEHPETEQHREYVRGWLQNLRNDSNLLADAIRDAEKASEYMEYHAGIIDKKTMLDGASKSRTIETVKENAAETEMPSQQKAQNTIKL